MTAPKLDVDHCKRVDQALARLADTRWPGVRALALYPLAGDASSRRYLRCILEHPRGAAVPPSAVFMLMDDPSLALSSEELGVFGNDGPAELPFVNVARFLEPICPAIPKIYDVAPDQTTVVLEDIGDLTLWSAANLADGEARFGAALELLAELQAHADDDGNGCYAFAQAFDERLLGWELEHFLEYGVANSAPASLQACRAQLDALAARIASLPRVFCHRDYHAWNLHVQGDRIRLIDFQDALLGPALYDVASLLTDRSTPRLIDPACEERLLCHYLERSGTGGRLGEQAARAAYHDCVLQRALKVIGRFRYLAEVKDKPRYLAYLPDVTSTARRAAAALTDGGAIAEVLEHGLKPLGAESDSP